MRVVRSWQTRWQRDCRQNDRAGERTVGRVLFLTAQFRPTFRALCLGLLGALTAHLVSLPAPFLTGPALAVSIACVFGLHCTVPTWLRDICFILIGIGMGAGITPQVVDAAAQWPATLAVLFLSLILILQVGSLSLRILFGFDRVSAVLASSPGHLSYVLGLSADIGADVQRVSIVQSLRILMLTMLVPLVFVMMSGDEVTENAAHKVIMPWLHIAGSVLFAACVGWALKRFRIPAAYLLGGMIVSGLFHASSFSTGHLPEWLSVSAFVVMGTLIGSRFSGITPRALGHSLVAGILTTAVAAGISIIASTIIARFLGLPINHVLIAFAPGGVETMAAMAVLLQVDPSFVAVHHFARLLFLTALVPIIVGRGRKVENTGSKGG